MMHKKMKSYKLLLVFVLFVALLLVGACVGQIVEHWSWFHYSSEFNLFELIYFIGSVIIATILVYLLEKEPKIVGEKRICLLRNLMKLMKD